MADIIRVLSCLLNCGEESIKKALYFGGSLVVDSGWTPCDVGQLLDKEELANMRAKYEDEFSVVTGYKGFEEAILKNRFFPVSGSCGAS